MKRDMDLVRFILLETEKAPDSFEIEELVCDAYDMKTIAYHVDMLNSYGLIDAKLNKAWGGVVVSGTIYALTWDGCDYLDAIREDKVWKKTKQVIKDSVGSTTLGVIKQTAVMVATKFIELAI